MTLAYSLSLPDHTEVCEKVTSVLEARFPEHTFIASTWARDRAVPAIDLHETCTDVRISLAQLPSEREDVEAVFFEILRELGFWEPLRLPDRYAKPVR